MLDAKQKKFRDRAVELAKKYAPRYGLDWRLMAAAAILESGWGQSALARLGRNYFGITAGKNRPGEKVYLLRSSKGARRFCKYADMEESFRAYGKLVGRSSLYKRARQMARDAALKYFLANLAPVYCPDDPDYRTKILQIVEMIDEKVKG